MHGHLNVKYVHVNMFYVTPNVKCAVIFRVAEITIYYQFL